MDYLKENFSKRTAEKFAEQVMEKIEAIQKFPTVGRKAPKRKTVRFIFWENTGPDERKDHRHLKYF